MEEINIQWFPGHMTKARRMISENVKYVDAVCEIIDARIPISSRNPDLDALTQGKPRLVIMNRTDQADPAATKVWERYFRAQGVGLLLTDSKSGKGTKAFSQAVRDLLKDKLESFQAKGQTGRQLRVMIVGIPNVGKSSLLNAILKEDRAIVSQYEGTTRDSIEEDISVDGVPLRIVDTAGIRNTDNEIEKIGIKKSRNIADCADLIIAIFDASRKLSKDDYDIIDIIKDRKAIILINKRDIENKKIEKNKLQELNKPIIEISALNREGINDLYKEITNLFKLNEININNEVIITNIRHLDLIRRAKENVINAINTINSNMPIDIISINIKDIIDCLNSITGESTSEDIINDIFSKFCLGK